MSVNFARRDELLGVHRAHDDDTGSTKVQIIVLTMRINSLSEHCSAHKCDKHALLGLVKMLSKRRRLLKYLAANSPDGHAAFIQSLGIRK